MRIALLTDGIYPFVIGGMQKHSYYLAKYFAAKSVHVDLYHTNCTQNELERSGIFSSEERKFIHAINIAFPKMTRFPGHYLKESYLFSQYILEEFLKRPPVNFIYAKGFCGWKMLEERATGRLNSDIPMGVNFHGYEMFQLQPSFGSELRSRFLLRKPVMYLVKNADHIFSYGGKITSIIKDLGVESKKIIEIPTGIESSWLVNSIKPSSSLKRFIFVGRHERRKGIEELMKVIAKIKGTENVRFEFVGDIPLQKRVTSSNIFYHGVITDAQKMRSVLAEADVLICPSFSEGMPNVILEAMACGLAVIATDVGAVSNMVSVANGSLIRPADLADLESKIRHFIAMKPEDLDKMKMVSLAKVKECFLWDNIIEKTIKEIAARISPLQNDK